MSRSLPAKVFLCFVFLCAFSFSAFAREPRVLVNGLYLRADVPAELREGRVYVPLGPGLAGALGGAVDVRLDGDATQAQIEALDTQIVFTEGSPLMLVDGEERAAAAIPYENESGLLMAGAGDLFGALGADVVWSEPDATLIVTLRLPAPPGVELPPEVFLPPAEPSIPETQIRTPETATGAEGMTDAELEAFLSGGRAVQYGFEHAIEFDVNTVSGDRTLSYLEPQQIMYERFTMRMQGTALGGRTLNGYIRSQFTSDRDSKKGEVQKANFTLERSGLLLNIYDIVPKYSKFALKNYRLQGVEARQSYDGFAVVGVMGKSPKKLRDSEYARWVAGAGIESGDTKQGYSVHYVVTRDTGSRRTKDKMENHVVSFAVHGKVGQTLTWESEYARSRTDLLFANTSADSQAFSFSARNKTRKTTVDLSVDYTGSDFYSETSFFTQGKHEYSMLINTKPNDRVLLGFGYKDRLLQGSRTRIFPRLVSLTPLVSRPDLRIEAKQNYERTNGANNTLIDNRTFSIRDDIGIVNAQFTLGRRKTRNSGSEVSMRTTRDYRVNFDVTPRLILFAQFNKEMRTGATTPLTRHARVKFTYEAGEWADFNIAFERYYNNSASNRFGVILGYRSLDVLNDTEIAVDYAYMNYREHDDQSLKFRYNIYQ